MEEKRPSHISYKDYQKKVNKNSNDGIEMFVSVFFILLLWFLGIAKQISPDIDVSIGRDDNAESETLGINKSAVDERLKLLQMEDKGEAKSSEEEMFASELDEKVVLPTQKHEEQKPEEPTQTAQSEKEATPKPSETAAPAPRISPNLVQEAQQQPVQTVSKVVVGYYSTKEQAEVAKGIISESGLNISPFVRTIGGAYTIQVGSYSSREKAQTMVNDLLRNNYPARIISE